jgi:hypothetical protein
VDRTATIGADQLATFEWRPRNTAIGGWLVLEDAHGRATRWLPCDAEPAKTGAYKDVTKRAAVLAKSEAAPYRPLHEHPALFRNFADLSNETSMLAFADKYGCLGSGVAITPTPVVDEAGLLVTRAEFFGTWEDAAQLMGAAIAMWDAWRTRSPEQIRALVDVAETDGWRVWTWTPSTVRDGVLGFTFTDMERIGTAQPGRRFEETVEHRVGMLGLQALVGVMLDGRCAPVLEPDGKGGMALAIKPVDLLAAMWLQLARAIGGNRHYKRCLVCNDWFEMQPYKVRDDRDYCSGKCRTRASRDPDMRRTVDEYRKARRGRS